MPRDILVVAEHLKGRLEPVSLEVAAFAKDLAGATGSGVTGVVLGHPALDLAREFARESGLSVLGVEHKELGVYNAEAYLSALAGIITARKFSLVLVPHTAMGWDFAPRLAIKLGGSCSTGVSGFSGTPPLFVRQICGGKMTAEVAPLEGTAAVVTVMPGAKKPVAAAEAGPVEMVSVEVDLRGTRTLGYEEVKRGELDLSKAEVIVAAGRGVGAPERLDAIRDLAACFDRGAVGASRPICDAGWLPFEHQVGMTGQTASPRLYLACGISGAIQHLMGISGSEVIAAINTDPRAAIFNVADLGVVCDLKEFLPVLTEKIRGKK